EFLKAAGYEEEPLFIPVSAKLGDNVSRKSGNTPWYGGPTLLEELAKIAAEDKGLDKMHLRLPVQDVYGNVLVGRVEAGVIRKGDEVAFTPSGRKATVTKVMDFGREVPEVRAGDNTDFEIDAETNGLLDNVCSHAGALPNVATKIRVKAFCIAGHSISKGEELLFKCRNG
ncbi:elongation factor 1-alpha, partial [Candidatus Micrarchaeota archaeon CG_4_10_14_0_2_um_filter_55_9]